MAYRVLHYLNQFFAGVGGEEKADITPQVREGVVGPGMALKAALGDKAEIVNTFICGDNYFATNMDAVCKELVDFVKKEKIDALVAGPAFNAGRYGTACGAVCAHVAKECDIPVVTALYHENPGADLYRKEVHIVETTNNAAGMRTAVPDMAQVLLKLLAKEEVTKVTCPCLLGKGIRENMFYEKNGAERAVDILVKKLNGLPFETEYQMPLFDRVEPRPAIADMSKATIVLVTSGGIVPAGNPDHIAASSAQNYGGYDITGIDNLREGEYITAHGGYDQTYANLDPDRILPVDVLRDMEKEGKIAKLYDVFYSTVGNGTAVASSKRFGTEIGEKLKAAGGISGVILTST